MPTEHGHILAIQSFGNIESEHDKSPGARGSRGRIIQASIELEHGGMRGVPREKLVAIFPQGYSKEHLMGVGEKPSLGRQMEKAFKIYDRFKPIRTIAEPLGWGTFCDLVNTCDIAIKDLGMRTATIYIVSEPAHIPRLKQVWRTIELPGWNAKFFETGSDYMSWFDRHIREPLARLHYWWRTR